ncbi:MAG: type II secretion system protein [Clostridium sp.]|nr:type II secretion system protein [Clostridium sp.]
MKKLRGFTLIELIAVISIIAILGGILVPKYVSYISKAKTEKAEQIARILYVSAMRSYLENESFSKSDVTEALNEDISLNDVSISVMEPTDDNKNIEADFSSDGAKYKVLIHGSSSSYEFKTGYDTSIS